MRTTVKPVVEEGDTIPPAQTFVRLCGRALLATAQPTELVQAGAALAPDEWRVVLAEATTQGMAPIVYQVSATSGALAAAPQEVATALAGAYSRTLVSVRRLELQLAEILQAFFSRAQDILVLKGPPLARRLYPDPALRPIGDIDLLARAGELQRATTALAALGYRPVPGQGHPTDYLALTCWTVVYQRDDAPLVEVHWRLMPTPGYQHAFRSEDLWRRSLRLSSGPESACRLNPEDELRYLCVHYAAQHRQTRLVWLVDLARFISALPDRWDWPSWLRTTSALGAATPVLASLRDCQAILGVELPDGARAALEAAAASPAERRAWAQAHAAFYQIDRLLAQGRALDTWRERRILARGVLTHFLGYGRDYTMRRLQLARHRLLGRRR